MHCAELYSGMRLGFGKNSGKFFVVQLPLIQYNTSVLVT